MEDVRAQYAELKNTMATYQASVGDCLEKAEAEFLQAYRAHMVEVHRPQSGNRIRAMCDVRQEDGTGSNSTKSQLS